MTTRSVSSQVLRRALSLSQKRSITTLRSCNRLDLLSQTQQWQQEPASLQQHAGQSQSQRRTMVVVTKTAVSDMPLNPDDIVIDTTTTTAAAAAAASSRGGQFRIAACHVGNVTDLVHDYHANDHSNCNSKLAHIDNGRPLDQQRCLLFFRYSYHGGSTLYRRVQDYVLGDSRQ
mmetsp:Transcript_20180/g.31182  ORF Transcript_20180/g.31182 Transcript_20180/m.31182 type:complete len:174 (+) Transcript_20180:115-636(+)